MFSQLLAPLLFLYCIVSIANAAYDFRITGEGGFFAYITDGDGNQIGARFLNPIYDPEGNRIGTNQGYTYYYPPDPGFTITAITEAESAYAAASFPTRTFYFKDGTLTMVNEAVVAGSGNYEKYAKGGSIREIITSNDPYQAEVWLLDPVDDTTSGAASGRSMVALGLSISIMLGLILS